MVRIDTYDSNQRAWNKFDKPWGIKGYKPTIVLLKYICNLTDISNRTRLRLRRVVLFWPFLPRLQTNRTTAGVK